MKKNYKIISSCIFGLLTVLLIWYAAEKNKNIAVDTNGDKNYPVVIIDAGHGTPDGGAVADDGTQEQYINLDIAKKLNTLLNEKGVKTIMTRTDDNSIHDPDKTTLRDKKVSDIHNRLNIIEENPGCVFVSIHQNYYTESKYSGTQVFYSENDPNSILLAEQIQKSVVSEIQPDNTRQVKPCGKSVYILYHSKEPSVLVECGFLSNKEETEKLKDENYRMRMANAVCNGLMNYLNGETVTRM